MTSDPEPGPNGAPLPPTSPYTLPGYAAPGGYGPAVYGPPSYGQSGYVPSPYGQNGQIQPGMLAAAADRERTMDVIKAAFGEGRITKEEFEARAARVLSARTYADLSAVAAGLPSGPAGVPPVQPYPYYQQMATHPRTSGLAIGSLTCAIGEIFTFGLSSVPAVVLGHAARSRIRRTGERGDAMALAGLILGYLGIGLWLLFIVAGIAFATRSSPAPGP